MDRSPLRRSRSTAWTRRSGAKQLEPLLDVAGLMTELLPPHTRDEFRTTALGQWSPRTAIACMTDTNCDRASG